MTCLHAAGLMLALGVLHLPRTEPTVRVDDVLAAAGRYVESFKQNFRVVISDERYQQRMRRSESREGRTVNDGGRRDIRSEMLFLGLPDERTWLTLRSVRRVDGREVADSGQRLERILAVAGPARDARLRQLLDESSRFNLGNIARNFSDPTLVLQFLQPPAQPHFAFTAAGVERRDGVEAVRLDFVERATPTVVTLNGQHLVSRGSVLVSRADGTVLETVLLHTSEPINLEATIRVTFRHQPAVGLSVPVRMQETYKQQQVGWYGTPPRTAIVGETIECIATYGNYRRFETSGRIIVPGPGGAQP